MSLLEIAFQSMLENVPTQYVLTKTTYTSASGCAFHVAVTSNRLIFLVATDANADKVNVSIEKEGSTVKIAVTDDGAGFDVEDKKLDIHRSGGFGLFNIRERLDYIGGCMEIQSQPGKGSRFTLIAPLKTGMYS